MSKPRKRRMLKLRISEISGVDNPAQIGARALIMKRADGKDVNKSDIAQAVTGITDGHQHGIRIHRYSDGEVSIWVDYAMGPDDSDNHSHALVRTAEGGYSVSQNAGHTHTISTEEMNAALAATITKGDSDMDPKELEKLQKSHARLGRSFCLQQLPRRISTRLRTKLRKTLFSTWTPPPRKRPWTRLKRTAGAMIRFCTPQPKAWKSGSRTARPHLRLPRPLTQTAKRLDTLVETNKTLTKQSEDARYEQRAQTELPNIPGTVASRISILKSIDAIEDEEQRKKAADDLKAQNAALGGMFKFSGTSVGKSVGVAVDDPTLNLANADDPQAKLDALTKKHQEANPGVSVHKAADAVLATEEGAALYDEIWKRDRMAGTGLPQAA